ncbi:MAG: type II toxin-antitoxin system HicA family toxin [Nitrospinae bacterium]|nr:type II toxin-antitoxin system HicA family toxin [Nitrospinota bacterium]MBF0633981.1 type II toxin-antitoxin system HicA family toxin [Nitrospinota bacterium]
MKRRDIERRLRDMGYVLLTGFNRGGNHDKWRSANGGYTATVPRHSETGENLARRILKEAERNKDK